MPTAACSRTQPSQCYRSEPEVDAETAVHEAADRADRIGQCARFS
jgi:hypothetical protein